MGMGEQKDTEIVLGTGKLLAIFFALAAMCGTFFGLGYSLGRNSGPMAIQSEESARLVSSPGAKPAAGVTVSTPPASDVTAAPAANPASAQADPAPSTNDAASEDASVAPTGTVKPAAVPPSSPTVRTPELASASGNITVQVAAVTKQEDAQALVAALKRKNYPVFVLPQSSADNLYHVQVGPFAELKDAEAMRSKLAGDGYNAIVKK
jgi:cell division septation protein DedD